MLQSAAHNGTAQQHSTAAQHKTITGTALLLLFQRLGHGNLRQACLAQPAVYICATITVLYPCHAQKVSTQPSTPVFSLASK